MKLENFDSKHIREDDKTNIREDDKKNLENQFKVDFKSDINNDITDITNSDIKSDITKIKSGKFLKKKYLLFLLIFSPSAIYLILNGLGPKTDRISFCSYKILKMVVLPSDYRPAGNFDDFAKKIKNCENIKFVSKNSKIGAFLFTPKIINEKTQFMVYCHGNGGDRIDYSLNIQMEKKSIKNNFVVLVIDYREFGDSEGVFTPDATNDDIFASINYLERRFYEWPNSKKVHLIGHSLGSGIVLKYVNDRNFSNKAVVCAPWATLESLCWDLNFVKPIALFVPFALRDLKKFYNSVSNAKGFLRDEKNPKNRLMILCGGLDTLIRCKHANKIQKATGCEQRHFNSCDHLTIVSEEKPWNEIKEFFKKN